MNQQARSLQRLADSVEPETAGAIRWLLHSANSGTGRTTVRDNLEVVLQKMGWNTGQFGRTSGSSIAQICETQEESIDVNRLVTKALLIFVLDGTPVTLVNTYSQIKQLLIERPELKNAIAVLSNRPSSIRQLSNPTTSDPHPSTIRDWDGEVGYVQCPAKTLIRSCQRFLNWEPAYLGALPYDSMVGIAASEKQQVVERWPSAQWSHLLQQAARRALMISQQLEESTQEPDMLSEPLDVLHSGVQKAYPTLA